MEVVASFLFSLHTLLSGHIHSERHQLNFAAQVPHSPAMAARIAGSPPRYDLLVRVPKLMGLKMGSYLERDSEDVTSNSTSGYNAKSIEVCVICVAVFKL
jgi:hypothetical protein